MKSDSLPISAAPEREKASSLWFFTAFFAVVLAGLAKTVIAERFSPQSSDSE
ncbi:hypothetical protein B1R32_102152 [Abditibacterium utsteinense]|uniref:Uncharacterized protein n=1 Tax=Abditibacterium utsteinense TaxID=1960156 RepID=A0A2S8SWJ3_9BACT|nr:hypothetical protein [Abditibacterium utsteinense]PQV65144.1 hypothetical protein B1R32_102152 [Abditibacterium utsteinense]